MKNKIFKTLAGLLIGFGLTGEPRDLKAEKDFKPVIRVNIESKKKDWREGWRGSDSIVISTEDSKVNALVYKDSTLISENFNSKNPIYIKRQVGKTELKFDTKDGKIIKREFVFLRDDELRKKIEDYYSSNGRDLSVRVVNKNGYPYEIFVQEGNVLYDITGVEKVFGMSRPQFALYYDRKTKMVHREIERYFRLGCPKELPKPDFGDLVKKGKLPKPSFEKIVLPKPFLIEDSKKLPKPYNLKSVEKLPKPNFEFE